MNSCLLCGEELKGTTRFTDLLLLKREEAAACQVCLAAFEPILDGHCSTCYKPGEREVCMDCQFWQSQGKTVRHRSCFIYNQAMKEYFSRYKFQGDYLLRYVFKKILLQALKERKGYTLVPVPVSQRKFEKRGFNQVCGLLDAAQLPYLQLLEKEDTQAQSSKSREERLKSQQCFRLLDSIEKMPERIILVDDIYTTGKTLQLAKEILMEAGVKEILTFSIAR